MIDPEIFTKDHKFKNTKLPGRIYQYSQIWYLAFEILRFDENVNVDKYLS